MELLAEFGRSLCQRQIVRYPLETAARLVFVDADRLEKQSFASHLDVHQSDLPVARGYLGLLDLEFAAFVQVSEEPTSKLYAARQVTLDFCQSIFLSIHPDPSLHGVEHLLFVRGWPETRVRLEIQLEQFSSTFPIAGNYRLGQYLEHTLSFLRVLRLVALSLALPVGVIYQLLNPLNLVSLLTLHERTTINFEHTVDFTILGLNDLYSTIPS